MGKTSAIADFNSYNITASNKLYAALKGAIDAGLSIPHDKDVVPDEERVSGAHIASYAEAMQKTDPAKYAAYFSQYLAAGIAPEKLVEHFEETKKRIAKGGKVIWQYTTTQWVPRTSLGKQVLEGKITSIKEVFEQNIPIKEPEIVDMLLPDMKHEVLDVNIVQKQTDAGEITKFKIGVVVGNNDGYIGMGIGKSKQMRFAIDKGRSGCEAQPHPREAWLRQLGMHLRQGAQPALQGRGKERQRIGDA